MTQDNLPLNEGQSGEPKPVDGASSEEADRREFLTTTSTVVMAGGLAAGYGTFFAMAGRFLFPAAGQATAWQFLAVVDEIGLGESLSYTGPSGATVVIARQERSEDAEGDVGDEAVSVEEFVALSDVCPHLGCKVHWEPQNKRFFCPCHNGAFDREGNATEGPPLADDQELTRFPLKIENGLLYIEVPTNSVVEQDQRVALREDGRQQDGGRQGNGQGGRLA